MKSKEKKRKTGTKYERASGDNGKGGAGGNTVTEVQDNFMLKNFGLKYYDLQANSSTLEEILENSSLKAKYNRQAKNYTRLIELLEMPHATSRICLTQDQNFIFASGIYPPQIRCFELEQLTQKFQRNVTSEVIDMICLSDDYKKLVLLQGGAQLEFHAQWGAYHKVKLPREGRSMAYDPYSCELLITSGSTDVYRLDLEAGCFRQTYHSYTNSKGINSVKICNIHRLIALGCDNGWVECLDPRSRKPIGVMDACSSISQFGGSLIQDGGSEITAMEFDKVNGVTFAAGTDTGKIGLFDLRKQGALYVKDHNYDEPIVGICFHDIQTNTVISADTKVIKLWDKSNISGNNNILNIEYPKKINDIIVLPKSGMIMCGGEDRFIKPYYVPSLGTAPHWCSFLDNITEEIEDYKKNSVQQDLKFVTVQDLEDLGLEDLIGTDMLRPHLHGYAIKIQLYNKALQLKDQKLKEVDKSRSRKKKSK